MTRFQTSDYGWNETEPESSTYLNPAVLALLKQYNVHKVLDAGCGNGAMAGFLADHGFAVTGMDADVQGIELARANHTAPTFKVGTFRDPEKESFDCVISTEVVEHLYAPHELAAFCYDSLKPGGIVIMSTPYHGYLKNLALSIVNRWDTHLDPHWHGGHIKFWSRSTLSTLLTRANFTIEEFVGVGRIPFLWKSMIIVARKSSTR